MQRSKAGTSAGRQELALGNERGPRKPHPPSPPDREDEGARIDRTWLDDMRQKLGEGETIDTYKLIDAKGGGRPIQGRRWSGRRSWSNQLLASRFDMRTGEEEEASRSSIDDGDRR